MTPTVALTIAGTDSGGAAGVAADLATFAALGAHGACVVTAVTAQDTTGVRAVQHIPPDVVDAQLEAVLDDLPVSAVKTGMLGSPEVVARVAALAEDRPRLPLVVDPVLVATSSAALGDTEVAAAYVELLLPRATVVTPNLDEARALAGADGPPAELARRLAARGPAVVLTGGGSSGSCTDWVVAPGGVAEPLTHPAVPTGNDHGTGCTFSAALAVHLARGVPLPAAARRAAAFTARQLRVSRQWDLGRGRGPIAHLIPSHHTEGEAP